jgi:predicted nucleic acid-binding protein
MRSVFIDTTVLIYARDRDFPMKAEQARTWLTHLTRLDEAVISPQVINEFVAVSLKRFRSVPREEVHARARALMPWCHAPLDAGTTADAMVVQHTYDTSWWDALIVASAAAAGCRFILSEDLQAGMRFGDITIINPFAARPQAVLKTN